MMLEESHVCRNVSIAVDATHIPTVSPVFQIFGIGRDGWNYNRNTSTAIIDLNINLTNKNDGREHAASFSTRAHIKDYEFIEQRDVPRTTANALFSYFLQFWWITMATYLGVWLYWIRTPRWNIRFNIQNSPMRLIIKRISFESYVKYMVLLPVGVEYVNSSSKQFMPWIRNLFMSDATLEMEYDMPMQNEDEEVEEKTEMYKQYGEGILRYLANRLLGYSDPRFEYRSRKKVWEIDSLMMSIPVKDKSDRVIWIKKPDGINENAAPKEIDKNTEPKE